MPTRSQVNGGTQAASVTTWTRLEPLTREASMQRSLQAQARDSLWFLARQYQMGEFLGDDAGSPLHASVLAEFRNITTYRPGSDDSKTTPTDPALPVEVHLERESVTLRLQGAVQLGRYFERLVRRSQDFSHPDQVIRDFRLAFPIKAAIPDSAFASPDALRMRSIVAAQMKNGVMVPGRVVNGSDLYASALASLQGTVPHMPLPSGSSDPNIQKILKDFVAFRQSVFCEPTEDSAWQSTKLDYDFALGSPVQNQNLLLAANDFAGGHVDWYSFSLQNASSNPVASQNPATVMSQAFDLLPNHVVFRGMPDSRWWNFEDGATDVGQLDTDHVDLPKLLVMEFALVFGNDWFSLPIPVPVAKPKDPLGVQASLSRIDTLVVTDSFGVRTLIRAAEQTTVNSGETPWSMYKLSGQNTRGDFILIAPTLGLVQEGNALENVLFLRDDMAAMAWAVEQQLQGDLDLPVDAFQALLQEAQARVDPAPAYTPGGPDIYYSLEKLPPLNWVPLVPVLSNQGAPYLRRGTLQIPDPNDPTKFVKLKAHASVLEPDHPFYVVDHAVPRSGVKVNRYFRFTRSFYGANYLWQTRKAGIGRGSGWSDGMRRPVSSGMRYAPNVRRARGTRKGDRL
jgi:hypothetical protein